MRALNITEINAVSGGEFTNLEVILGGGLAGGTMGSVIGAMFGTTPLLALFAPEMNRAHMLITSAIGAPIGCAIGLGVSTLYTIAKSAFE